MIDTLLTIGFSIVTVFGSVYAFYYKVKSYFQEIILCPKIEDGFLFMSACELAEKIRNKEVTCERVVKTYMKRIYDVNPIINAVVEDRFALAIDEAKKYDLMIANNIFSSSELKIKYPLLGIPISVKESIAVQGMSHSAAQVHLKDYKATRDADVVKRIKDAGGIILLVSNTPELCCSLETDNYITGTTNNPYDSRRTPAGSSGGEAALIGSGASLIGIGSDMLGSVRLPGSFCGIWAHKPTAGIVSLDTHVPTCNDPKMEDILTIGPLTRYQVDLSLVLNVILKDYARSLVDLNKSISLQDITIYYTEDYSRPSRIDPDILQAIKLVVHHLKYQCKCKIEKITFQKINLASIIFYKYLGYMTNFPGLFENHPRGYALELFLFLIRRSNLSLSHILLGSAQKIFTHVLPQSVFTDCSRQMQELKEDLYKNLGNNGVLLYPTHPTAATFKGHFYKKILDYDLTSVFNTIGFPATQCPVGLNTDGLPIGIQVAAVANNDSLCLKVAEEINNLYKGWIPPRFSK